MKLSKRDRIPAAQEQFTVHGINGTTTMNRAAYDDYKAALDDRRSKGRYTLEEAAMLIAKETGERAYEMLKKLMQARRDYVLVTHEPGKQARYQSNTVRDFYEEAYWNGLNAWLVANESRIAWRFPKPVPKRSNFTNADWKVEARKIADECFERDTKNKCRDSLAGYSLRVMNEMQERGINSARGRIDNHKTVQREALQAAKWWSNKAR